VGQVADSGTVLLIHGGLWDDTGADFFWRRTGVADGLTRRGFKVIAPDRLRRPTDWTAEARHIASAAGLAGDDAPSASPGTIARRGLTVVGGSFGCAAAARLMLDFPGIAGRLVLAWPASVSDQFTSIRVRSGLSRQGARGATLDALLGGGTLPGATDAELGRLDVPAGIVPSVPPNPLHPRAAVDALLRLLPSAVELPGCPEAPRLEFQARREAFLDAVAAFAVS
jgi:pimeloyl-ACP methyl ester carboxylesterase